MKYYLLALFFCLGSFHVSAEEVDLPESAVAPSETPSVEESHDEESHEKSTWEYEMPGVWADEAEKQSESFQYKFLHMLLVLGLLIIFMFLASFALKRMMKTKVTQLNTVNDIKVLETRHLSPKATLYLVQVQDQRFLLGESPTHISHLASFPLEPVQKL